MARTGVIAGTAFRRIGLSEKADPLEISTRFGTVTVLESEDMIFLPRHGMEDSIPPHRINHRANLSAFKELEVSTIIGVNSVGSLKPEIPPKTLQCTNLRSQWGPPPRPPLHLSDAFVDHRKPASLSCQGL